MSKTLKEQDFIDAAAFLGVEVPVIKAVAKVESRNSGFNKDGSPKILFEGHWFWRFTNGMHGNTMYSYPRWIRTFYNMSQHKRLQAAVKKNRNAALKSASWGMFQIMGFNYKKAGHKTLQSFINAMYRSEREHLFAFCHFIKNASLVDELQNKDWARFAYGYNGPRFRENAYHTKMANAYGSFIYNRI